jgi:ABC-type uncharacterized transport system auxiliary subunit
MIEPFPRVNLLLAARLACFLLCGCASSPQTTLYVVDASGAAAFRLDQPLVPTISVHRVWSADYLEVQDILYRDPGLEVGYYRLHRWAATPRELVERSMVSALRESNLAAHVFSSADRQPSDIEIELEVTAFGEQDRRASDDRTDVFGRVELRLLGVDRRGGQVRLIEHHAVHEEPAAERSHASVVLAIDAALKDCLNRLVTALRADLESR